jgi:hypothetical protein
MHPLESFEEAAWDGPFRSDVQDRAVVALEHGRVLHFGHLGFALEQQELRFLSSIWADRKAKNISFEPSTGQLGGTNIEGSVAQELAGMMRRYAASTLRFLGQLLPKYGPALEQARTSFRPHEIEGREIRSYRKDDRRLHIDAFPSRPTRGARILRVFTNINPSGKARVWHLSEPFDTFVDRFLPRVRHPILESAWIEALLRITKGQRTLYDHIMLQLHDEAKRDTRYQQEAPRHEIAFSPGSTWVVLTDMVPHAAMTGRFVLEQTFLLPAAALLRPELSPLRILELRSGKSLIT